MGKYRDYVNRVEANLSEYAIKSDQAEFLDGSRINFDDNSNIEKIGYRTPFQLDRDRILHSKYFDLLAEKTQIFIASERELLKNGPFRNRMTHTNCCSNIARSIALSLGLNDALVEAVALGHDLGHTPFGHTGEETLKEIMSGAKKQIALPLDGLLFLHGRQSLRI